MIQPLQDRIVVECIPEPEGTIVLTDAPPYRKFKVIAVGPGKWDEEEGKRRPMESKPGDIVVLPGVAVTDPDHQIGKQLFVREADIGWKVHERRNIRGLNHTFRRNGEVATNIRKGDRS